MNRLFKIKGQRVMFDFQVAELYGVPVEVLNEAVDGNIERFPGDFMFDLTDAECDELAIYSHDNPSVFTSKGIAMLSSILCGHQAVDVSIAIIRGFFMLRQEVAGYEGLRRRTEAFESNTGAGFPDVYRMLVRDWDKS